MKIKNILKPKEEAVFKLDEIVYVKKKDMITYITGMTRNLQGVIAYMTQFGVYSTDDLRGFSDKSTLEAFIEMSANTNISDKAKAAIDEFLN